MSQRTLHLKVLIFIIIQFGKLYSSAQSDTVLFITHRTYHTYHSPIIGLSISNEILILTNN